MRSRHAIEACQWRKIMVSKCISILRKSMKDWARRGVQRASEYTRMRNKPLSSMTECVGTCATVVRVLCIATRLDRLVLRAHTPSFSHSSSTHPFTTLLENTAFPKRNSIFLAMDSSKKYDCLTMSVTFAARRVPQTLLPPRAITSFAGRA
jgi:hypothetical protein